MKNQEAQLKVLPPARLISWAQSVSIGSLRFLKPSVLQTEPAARVFAVDRLRKIFETVFVIHHSGSTKSFSTVMAAADSPNDLRHCNECSSLAEAITHLWRGGGGGTRTAGSLPRPFYTTLSSVSRATPIVYHDRASNFLHVLRDFSGPLRHWTNGHIIGTDTSAVCPTMRSKECSCGTRLLDL